MENISKCVWTDENKYYLLKLHQMPGIYRAISIASDPKGNNIAVLQVCEYLKQF